MYNVQTHTPTFFSEVEHYERVHRSWYPSVCTDFGLHSVKQRKYWEETRWVSGFVCSCFLAPTWCWCCGLAHTVHCCCWCWGYDGSCWAWVPRSDCLYRWGSHAELRCQRIPDSQHGERKTAAPDRERLDSWRPHRTGGGKQGQVI